MENIGTILALVSIPLFLVGLVMLIIQIIRKKKKKASLIVMLVSVLLFVGGFGMFAVGETSGHSPTKELTEETVEKNARSYIIAYCTMHYDCKTVSVHTTTVEIKGNIATAKGKVSIIDDYGDKYEAKFDYTVKYSAESGFYDSSLDMATPTKSK